MLSLKKRARRFLILLWFRFRFGKHPPIHPQSFSIDAALRSVGEGWHALVLEFYVFIHANFPDVYVTQVKEKFGGLAIYTSQYLEPILVKLHKTLSKSYAICEVCGDRGTLVRRSTGWMKTLCAVHGAGCTPVNHKLFVDQEL